MIVERHPTTALSRANLAALRDLLELSYLGDFSEDDWAHALGGVHALAFDGKTLVGHGALVTRTLLAGGRAWHTGYVEALAVRPSHRRRGIGGSLMESLEGLLRQDYELGALSPSDDAVRLYRARGWLPWRGPTFASVGATPMRTESEDGNVFIFAVRELPPLDEALTCDARSGDPW